MVKKLTLVSLVILFCHFATLAQDTTKIVVPKKVANKMLAINPQTQVVPVTWTKEGINYKGTLKIMEKPAVFVFDSTGKLLRSERKLHVTYLPKKVTESLNKQYPGNEILEIYEITDAADKKTYRTTFQYKQTSTFNADGVMQK